MAAISLRGVEKFYGGLQVLFDCSLEIADHEFIVLVGPSGSGKTTLLRIIAGLEDISGGELYFGEKRMNEVDVGDRDIAMVFQNYGLYPHMSVFENMAFGLKRRGLPQGGDRRAGAACGGDAEHRAVSVAEAAAVVGRAAAACGSGPGDRAGAGGVPVG